MSDSAPEPKLARRIARNLEAWLLSALLAAGLTSGLTACASASLGASPGNGAEPTPDAPVMASQPGAWFDAQGNLTIVGPGRRLRLVLSAPITVCNMPSGNGGESTQTMGLPFSSVAEACRQQHSTILLAEESEGASPTELERSYHDVAHCAASDFGLNDGWVPATLEQSDPCPQLLGLGWRMPSHAELQGLTVDDRKAVAGALFDTGASSNYGALLLYTQDAGKLGLATLSPNASEVAPELAPEKKTQPLVGAALRCVRDASSTQAPSTAHHPPLPHARECMKAQAQDQGLVAASAPPPPSPDVERLRAWVELVRRAPRLLQNDDQIKELAQLLASPELERIARDAASERALTEHYSELAESVDDPQASPAERERRRQEFEHLRRKLGGQIVHSATSKTTEQHLPILLTRVVELLETARNMDAKSRRKSKQDFGALIARARDLAGNKAQKP